MLELFHDDDGGSALSPDVAEAIAHLRGGRSKEAANVFRDVDETGLLGRQLTLFHDQVWFPGGFTADAEESVLTQVFRDIPDNADPLFAAATELQIKSHAWRFMVLGSTRVDPAAGVAAARRMVDDLLGCLDRLRQRVGDVLTARGLLVAADVLRLGGEEDAAAEYCRQAHDRFAAEGDDAGIGDCHLFVADAVLSPWSSPELMGLDPWELTRRPHEPPAGSRELVETACTDAETAFRRAGSNRGLAASLLRRCFLASLSDRTDEAAEQAARAGEFAAEAGDDAFGYLAATHRLVALVAGGHAGSLRTELPAEVATWARTVGSSSYVRALAMLLRGTSGRWLRAGRPEPARLLLAVALEIADGIGHDAERLACLSSTAELYGGLNSRGPAIGTLHGALQDYLDAGTLTVDAWMQASNLLVALTNQYVREGHPGGLAWCEARAAELGTRCPLEIAAEGDEDEDIFSATRRRFDALPELGKRRFTANGGPHQPGFVETMAAQIAGSLRDSVAQTSVLAPVADGLAKRRAGLDALADNCFRKALDIATKLGPRGASVRAVALAAARRYDEVAKAVQETTMPADLMSGLLLQARAYAAAAELQSDSEPAIRADEPTGWEAVLASAETALRTGDFGRARRLTTEARVAFERRLGTLSRDAFRVAFTNSTNARQLYQLAAETGLLDGDVAESFRLGDRLRSLPLVALLGEPDTVEKTPVLRWRRANAAWSAAYDLFAWQGMRPAAARAHGSDPAFGLLPPETSPRDLLDAAQLELEVAEATLSLRSATTIPAAPDLVELRAALAPGTVVVQYLLAGDRLLIWALTEDELDGVALPVDTDRIAGHVNRVHAACGGRYVPGDAEASRQELSRLLLDPVANHLEAHRRAVIIPSGALNLLPFSVLQFRGQALGGSHVLSILPAASLLPRLAGIRGEGAVLVVGDPPSSDPRLPRLPATRVEALGVARHYDTTPLLGDQATKAAVAGRLPAVRIAHLATHGLVSDIAPTASGIVLDGGERLTVTDLAGLDLDADLVVLSACDTGRGEVTLGGDVVGLARQLLATGVRSALVSLWPVDDLSTCVLMDDFHRRLADGEPAAEALHGAQQYLRSQTREELHERYAALCASVGEAGTDPLVARRSATDDGAPLRAAEWAAFVLIGRP
ncbi:hypothetical protein Amsp01_090680 [Amycolatopsis sp. NBRC 101858]|uniref:CHAT domain-containing protein n=1 Tax=Amycolatopsis sp. NBRC 101858 TaxID=3032200 RepID=UPI00249FE956|nr:CHAT domain-containing protein [Amycolatopsis sp. NBRC 101858]GLY43045.1 hypothetical protein Amsp01_090680 [Amycolatopsis sp. NBRC 101858]